MQRFVPPLNQESNPSISASLSYTGGDRGPIELQLGSTTTPIFTQIKDSTVKTQLKLAKESNISILKNAQLCNSTAETDKSNFAIPDVPVHCDDSFKDLRNFLITLYKTSSKSYCNNLQHVLRWNREIITAFTAKIQAIGAILKHSSTQSFKFLSDLGFEKT